MVIARRGGSFRPSPREVGFGDRQCRADVACVHCDPPYQAAVLLLQRSPELLPGGGDLGLNWGGGGSGYENVHNQIDIKEQREILSPSLSSHLLGVQEF